MSEWMKDLHTETIKNSITDGLRELYRRGKDEDDHPSLCVLWFIEGYFQSMMKALTEEPE